MTKYYVDYRFIVDANDEEEANKKVDDLIGEATDDVWYTIARIIEAEKASKYISSPPSSSFELDDIDASEKEFACKREEISQ